MQLNNRSKCIASIFICQLAGFLGALYTQPAIPGWYAALNKPAFTPPDRIFAPVWTGLYVLMGVALFLIWKNPVVSVAARRAKALFMAQLALNVAWSGVFFGLRWPLGGLAVIWVLWPLILATVIVFYRLSKPAGLLLVPYLAWVGFAAVLNYFIWILNR